LDGNGRDEGKVPLIEHSFWYLSRAAGIAAYVLLSLSMIWGLALSTKFGERFLAKPALFEAHRVASIFVPLFIALHAGSLLGDTFIAWDAKSLLLPFQADYRPGWVGAGVLAAYLCALLTASFYVRQYIGHRAWRSLHYLSFLAFIGSTGHGLMAGTDTREPWMMAIYGFSAAAVVFLVNLRLIGGAKEPRQPRPAPHARPAARSSEPGDVRPGIPAANGASAAIVD
jgi:predicted ferric reductase